MKFKKIVTVLCAAMLLTSVFASCSKKNTDDFNSQDSNVSIVDGTSSTSSDATSDNASSGPSAGEVVSTYDPAGEYNKLPTVSTSIKKNAANVSTTYFAVDDEYIYYIDNDDEGIYKIAKDGSGTAVQLSDAKVSTIDINSDGKLDYTVNKEDGMDSNSFTMDKDGKNVVDNHQLILDYFGPTEYTGKDGKIYANLGENDGMDESGIYVREKGQDVEKSKLVKAGFIDSFCLVEDYLVISISGMEGTSVYRCKLDGSDMVKAFDVNASRISAAGDTIYFINQSDNNLIYEVSLDAIKNAK